MLSPSSAFSWIWIYRLSTTGITWATSCPGYIKKYLIRCYPGFFYIFFQESWKNLSFKSFMNKTIINITGNYKVLVVVTEVKILTGCKFLKTTDRSWSHLPFWWPWLPFPCVPVFEPWVCFLLCKSFSSSALSFWSLRPALYQIFPRIYWNLILLIHFFHVMWQ